MAKKKHDSVFTLDSYTSTTTLARNDQFKIPIGSSVEKVYRPYENRKLEHPNTYAGALAHLVKSSLGSGILSMPRAFHSAGLLVGLFGTVLVGLLCTHTVHILVRASQRMCILTKTPSLGYAETAEQVFKNGPRRFQKWSTVAKNFAEIALVLTYNVGCSVYIVFISESVVKLSLFDECQISGKYCLGLHPPEIYWLSILTMVFFAMILTFGVKCAPAQLKADMDIIIHGSDHTAFHLDDLVSYYYAPAGDAAWSQYFKLMMLFPLILLCQVRELKHLVPFSFIANITMSIAFGITLYYMFSEIKDVNVDDRKMATGIGGLPVFFSTVIFSMEGIGTIMPVENSMVTSRFLGCPGVLNMGMTVIVTLFSAMGFFGYFAYGDKTKDAITANLPEDEVMAQVVQAAISTSVFFTFMLQYYVPTEITWKKIRPRIPERHHNIAEIITRTLLVCFIISIAAAAGKNLGPLIDLAGSIFLATLGFLIPAVLDIVVNWGNWGKFNHILVKDLLLCMFSLLGTAAGTHSAIKGFMKSE